MPAPASFFQWNSALARPRTLLRFDGVPEPGDFDRLLARAEDIVVQRTADRRPFRAVIECLQNLERHAEPGRPICFHLEGLTVKGAPRFRIRTLNHVRDGERQDVSLWLDRHAEWQENLTSTSSLGLAWRGLHRDALANEARTPRGGAGLGWLSLARHAVRPPVIGLRRCGRGERLFFSVEVACAA